MINTLHTNRDTHLHQNTYKNTFSKRGKKQHCVVMETCFSLCFPRVWNRAPPLRNTRLNCTAAVSGSIFRCVSDSLFVKQQLALGNGWWARQPLSLRFWCCGFQMLIWTTIVIGWRSCLCKKFRISGKKYLKRVFICFGFFFCSEVGEFYFVKTAPSQLPEKNFESERVCVCFVRGCCRLKGSVDPGDPD